MKIGFFEKEPNVVENKKMENKKNKLGQEEMVGFAVIIILVSVGLLILLSFIIKGPSQANTESYQIESFIQSALQYTTDCENQIEFLDVQNLIISCDREENCIDGRNSCDVLNSTFSGIMDNAWNTGNQSATKGYNLKITIQGMDKLVLQKGNETSDYNGGFQDFARSGRNYEVSLNVYS